MRERGVAIDLHMHLVGSGCCQSGIRLSSRLRSRYTIRMLRLSQGISRQEMEHSLDRLWVERTELLVRESSRIRYGVVLGLDGVFLESGAYAPSQTHFMIPDSWVFRAARESSHLLPGPSLHPYRPDSVEQLHRLAEEGAVLIKWLPSVQKIDPAHPSLGPFYEALVKLGLPLLVHTGGERTFLSLEPAYNSVSRLERALEAGVTLILAHSGTRVLGSGDKDELPLVRSLLERYPRLYLDNSGLCNPSRFSHLARLGRDPLILSRTLYGSDWPVPSNAFYYMGRLPLRKILSLERIPHLLDRDVAIKESFGYGEETLTRASFLLPHLDRWMKETLPSG